MQLGCGAQEGQLYPGPIPPHPFPARRQKAIGAVAASILTAIYHMLKNGTCYQDLGPDHFDRRAKTTKTKRLVARLQNLGYAVQITPLAA